MATSTELGDVSTYTSVEARYSDLSYSSPMKANLDSFRMKANAFETRFPADQQESQCFTAVEQPLHTEHGEAKRDKLAQQIEEELTCTVCLGTFVEPKVLPCLHTYCKKCIKRLVKKGSTKVVCPQCREEHVLPGGEAENLLTSFTFTNLVKLLDIYKANTKALTCENGLDTNPAVARCVVCQAYLCDSCCQMHKRMLATKSHTTISLDEIKMKGEKCFQSPHHCPVHENEVLKLYCRTCSKTICGDCTYVDHRSHNYVFIKDVSEELKRKLHDRLNSMKRLSGEAKNKKEIANKVVDDHEAKVATIRANVDRTFSELTEHVKRCHQKVLQDVDQQATARKKTHSTNVEEAELAHTHLTNIVAFIERLLQSSDACEISTMANYAIEQCKKLEANQQGETEKSCDWVLEGVEKSKESLQCVVVKQFYPSPVKSTKRAHGLSNGEFPQRQWRGQASMRLDRATIYN